jgi:hypothetical protein
MAGVVSAKTAPTAKPTYLLKQLICVSSTAKRVNARSLFFEMLFADA